MAVVAAVCQITIEEHFSLNSLILHKILGLNAKISAGVDFFIQQMSTQLEEHDQAPLLLVQFLMIQAKSDERVSKIIGSQNSFRQFVSEMVRS